MNTKKNDDGEQLCMHRVGGRVKHCSQWWEVGRPQVIDEKRSVPTWKIN